MEELEKNNESPEAEEIVQETNTQQPVKTEILREENEKSLRCGICGRHIVSIITNLAVVQGTCQRRTCKKINRFVIEGNKTTTEVFDKPKVERY